MGKALIVYATRTGETKRIGELIAEGIRMQGQEADVRNVTGIKNAADLEGYDAYAFGSATYHGDMMQVMKKMLFLAEKAKLEGKVGGSFGAFGWSGEAPNLVLEIMKNRFEMDVVEPALRIKYNPDKKGLEACRELGKVVAEKVLKKSLD